MNKLMGIIAAGLLCAGAAYAALLLIDAGAFKTIVNQGTSGCHPITAPGLVGPEDLVQSADGRVFISVNDRLSEGGARPASKTGLGLFVLDPDNEQPHPLPIEAGVGADFHPHGLDLYRDAAGAQWLYVINHRASGDRLEVFQIQGATLAYQRSLDLPFNGANDVLVWDAQRIYVTFDHNATSPLGRRLEDYARLGRGFVAMTRGDGRWTHVADGLAYANGIARLKSGDHIAVAAMLGRSYSVYQVAADGLLQKQAEVAVGSGVDNITVDADGVLWIAAHPQLLALKAMSHDRSKRSPSEILRVRAPLDPLAKPEPVFMDDGGAIAAASVALHVGQRLVLGSVFDDHLLSCPLTTN